MHLMLETCVLFRSCNCKYDVQIIASMQLSFENCIQTVLIARSAIIEIEALSLPFLTSSSSLSFEVKIFFFMRTMWRARGIDSIILSLREESCRTSWVTVKSYRAIEFLFLLARRSCPSSLVDETKDLRNSIRKENVCQITPIQINY